MPKVSAQAARIAKKGSEMFRVFFCALVCNLSRFDGVFSSCARVFLPRLAGVSSRGFVLTAPCWRAAEVTRVRALLLSRRKYRLRRKLFLCPRAVFPRRALRVCPRSDWCPCFASFSAVNFAFGGKFFSAAASCRPRRAVSSPLCRSRRNLRGSRSAQSSPPRVARRGRLFFGKFCPFGKNREIGERFARRKSFKRRGGEDFFSEKHVLWEKTGNRGAICPPKKS